jgi:hypothetical protein
MHKHNPFLKKDSDRVADDFGFKPLDSYKVSNEDLYIRAWYSRGHQSNPSGFFIQRLSGEWSGEFIDRTTIYPELKKLIPSGNDIYQPSDTWSQVGNQLLRMDVLLLPDVSTFKKIDTSFIVLGGEHLFVEVRSNKGYRNYYYQFMSSRKMYDFNDPFVVDAFLSAGNLKNILIYSLKFVEQNKPD